MAVSYPRWTAATVLAGAALLLVSCGHADTPGDGAGSAPSHTAAPSRTPSASPSASCPGRADVLGAADEASGSAGGQPSRYQVTRRGVLACERGYATAEVLYPGAGTNVVVMHLAGQRWRPLIMGSDVCSGDGDDGRDRPAWMVGVPDSVVQAAHCQPDFYRD